MQSKEPDIKAKNTIVNKIKNGSSLFANFISHAVTASPKVQKNFFENSGFLRALLKCFPVAVGITFFVF